MFCQKNPPENYFENDFKSFERIVSYLHSMPHPKTMDIPSL